VWRICRNWTLLRWSALNFNSKKDDLYQSINRSISISQHISLLAHDRKKCSSHHHFMPADAAPLNERRLFPSLFLSLFVTSFEKNFGRQYFPVCYPPCFRFNFHVWSPNYCGVVALAVFFLVVVLSFEVFHIIIVDVVVWMLDVVDCRPLSVHLLLLLQGSKRARVVLLPHRPPPPSADSAAAYSCGGAAAASAAASSPSPAVSEVQSVRLSRSSCMIRVLSL